MDTCSTSHHTPAHKNVEQTTKDLKMTVRGTMARSYCVTPGATATGSSKETVTNENLIIHIKLGFH